MEFWGTEVKPGQTVKCEPGKGKVLHLSQAALGETKKAAENVVLYVKFNDQKLVLATLNGEKCAHVSHDLVFEQEFELSHSSKNASVHFTGYRGIDVYSEVDSEVDSEEDSEEEDVEVAPKANSELKVNGALVKSNAEKDAKSNAKAEKPILAEQKDDSSGDEGESDDDEEGSDESDDDEDMVEADSDEDEDDDDDDEDDDDDDDEDDETPKPVNGKKRPAEAVTKAAAPEKKAKLATPADGKKTDAKKGTPAKSDKGKQQTPKSGGSVSCKSCSKTFNSESALESHSKAKHAAAK